MSALKLVNDVLMFLVELGMLVLLYMGVDAIVPLGGIVNLIISLVLPGIAVAIWSWKLAPKSGVRLTQPTLAAVKMMLFILAAFVGTFWDSTYATAFILLATMSVIGEYTLGSNADKYRL